VGPGRQGQPPVLPGRRLGRRGRQHRRRDDLLQLRRLRQIRDPRRRRGLHRLQHRAGGPGAGRRRGDDRLGLGDHQGRRADDAWPWSAAPQATSRAGRPVPRHEGGRRRRQEGQQMSAPTIRSGFRRRGRRPLVEAGMVVGLGTGSTAAWFVKALARASWTSGACRPRKPPPTWPASLGLRWRAGRDQVDRPDRRRRRRDRPGPVADQGRRRGPAAREAGLGGLQALRGHRRRRQEGEALGKFPLPIEVVAFGHVHTGHRMADDRRPFEIAAWRLRMAERRRRRSPTAAT
jgi:hypothetical protein